MTLKKYLAEREIKNAHVAKEIQMDPSRFSLCLNGYLKFPKKYHKALSDFLGLPIQQILKNEINKED